MMVFVGRYISEIEKNQRGKLVWSKQTNVQKNRENAESRLGCAKTKQNSPTLNHRKKRCPTSPNIHRDQLEVLNLHVVFRLFAVSCHLRHIAMEDLARYNVVVSRGVNHCHFPKRNNVRPWSLTVLAYQAYWLSGNWDSSSYESPSNEIVEHVMSGRSPQCRRLQTRLCRPRASTGESQQQRWGTSSSRRKLAATQD